MKTLIVIAGGECSRMGNFLKDEFKKIPKHLLPLPILKMTLVESVVYNGLLHFDQVIIEANYQNGIYFESIFDGNKKVVVEIDDVHSGPLGPVARRIITQETVYACAGDMYCEFSWDEFEKFHNKHDRPVSILVAKSIAVPKGARFIIGNERELSWERVAYTNIHDLINIGAYIIDRNQGVLDIFDSLNKLNKIIKHKEDEFFDLVIKKKLAYAYDPKIIGFNINVPLSDIGLFNYIKNKK